MSTTSWIPILLLALALPASATTIDYELDVEDAETMGIMLALSWVTTRSGSLQAEFSTAGGDVVNGPASIESFDLVFDFIGDLGGVATLTGTVEASLLLPVAAVLSTGRIDVDLTDFTSAFDGQVSGTCSGLCIAIGSTFLFPLEPTGLDIAVAADHPLLPGLPADPAEFTTLFRGTIGSGLFAVEATLAGNEVARAPEPGGGALLWLAAMTVLAYRSRGANAR